MRNEGELFGDLLLQNALSKMIAMLRDKRGRFLFGHVGKEFERVFNIGVVDVDPILVELVRAGFIRVEPECAGRGFAHLLPVALEE